ncbi:hypothetical protein KP509_18G016900 [Ceratopteris richardii]|uniref:PORR domain-containing protein n=1 Tax=Ceratopteris richardii TaxID=49495 RepID=A0A8T2SPZ3_CERRI|nr:hypothetical protein KP509_18G016900 [Ceratopteris richardii]
MVQVRRWSSRRWHQLIQIRGMSRNIPGMTPRTREKDFEKLVENDKAYKKVMALKSLLVKEPENVLSFAELGRLRTRVGLPVKTHLLNLISRYTGVFALYRDEYTYLWCGFSPIAQILVDQERSLVHSYESIAVQKIRKLLMMSVDHRIRVPKIAHLRRDLGLPLDFSDRMIFSYPEYFKVVEEKYRNEDGPVIVLTSWDPSLAVTSLEVRAKASSEFNSYGEPLFKMSFPKGLKLSTNQKESLEKFQERVFISPYTDIKDFSTNTPEFEKHQIAILHEILSMTLEKKLVFDHLTHFQKEYRLPKSLLSMVLRHNYIFYISRKGGRFVIFLKEAYKDGHLIEKNEWNIIKENFMILMDNRKLKESELSKAANERPLKVENDGNVKNVKDEEDEDIDALMLLCHKIKKNADNFMPNADNKNVVLPDMIDEGFEGSNVGPADPIHVSDMLDCSCTNDNASRGPKEWDFLVTTSDDDDDADGCSSDS